MKDFDHAVKEINVPDIVQKKAQNAFTQIQEESRMRNNNVRRRLLMNPALAAAAIAAVVLIGGCAMWATNGGLAGFLSKFMPEEEVNGRLDIPSENEIEINQSEDEDYGPLWTVEEYWYDGATLYFSATAPTAAAFRTRASVLSVGRSDGLACAAVSMLLFRFSVAVCVSSRLVCRRKAAVSSEIAPLSALSAVRSPFVVPR